MELHLLIKEKIKEYGSCKISFGSKPKNCNDDRILYLNNKSNRELYKDKEVSIYVIKSYGKVIYVGQTKEYDKRKSTHIFNSKRLDIKKPLYEFMSNNEYEFEVVKTCLYQDRFIEENKMIEYYSLSNILFNTIISKGTSTP